MTVRGDNPITAREDDLLGRSRPAAQFVDHLLSLDSGEGLVAGVLGAWGSGKTSFVNLAREGFDLANVPVVDFNPWMFSGTEQLVNSFFIEVGAQLRLRPDLNELGERLGDYGDVLSAATWIPLIGPWINRGRGAFKTVGKILARRNEGIEGTRSRVADALAQLERPVVVIVDDIDRLETNEIRDVFKLVRLTASFPNLIYVLAFDRRRIEQALGEHGVPGRDYLEKILQVTLDLPTIPDQVMNSLVLDAINDALGSLESTGPFDQDLWPDVFVEVIRPLIRNMRDVRRYAAGVTGAADLVGPDVALVDLLALEAVRVFLPDTFVRLPHSVAGLTTPSPSHWGREDEPPDLKSQVQILIDEAGPASHVLKAMVHRLFPAAQRHVGGSHYDSQWERTWLRERRIAHADILRLYLEKVGSESLDAFLLAEQAFRLLGDQDALEAFFESLDVARWEDIIASLETFEDQFEPAHVLAGTVVLLNLLPRLPERERDIFSFGKRIVVTRVTYRLVKAAGDPTAIEAVVDEAIPRLTRLSGQLELITHVGHRENAGHKLISRSAAERLDREWRDRVRQTSPTDLAEEPDLLRVLWLTSSEADSSEPTLKLPDLPRLTWALLRSARSWTRSQSMGSRSVRRSPRLSWNGLVEVLGGEPNVRDRISKLEPVEEGDAELLELARKYLSGWRPEDFDDD